MFNGLIKNMRVIQLYRPVNKSENDGKVMNIVVNKLDKWAKRDKDKWNVIIMGI